MQWCDRKIAGEGSSGANTKGSRMQLKFGTLLVEEGLITVAQLEEALQVQSSYGGKLGTNLIELGFANADELVLHLAHAQGFPPATQELFDNANDEALEALPGEIAERFNCFPLKIEGRQLHLAMAQPGDLPTVDAIGFRTGLRIVPYQALEIQLFYNQERRYGRTRQMRYIQLTPATLNPVPAPENGPAIRGPGWNAEADALAGEAEQTPETTPEPASKTAPEKTSETAQKTAPQTAPDSSPEASPEATPKPPSPDSPESPIPNAPAPTSEAEQEMDASSAAAAREFESSAFDTALELVAKAQNREELASAVILLAEKGLGQLAILRVKGEQLRGWRASGGLQSAAQSVGVKSSVSEIDQPLANSSTLLSARKSERGAFALPASDPGLAQLCTALGWQQPETLFAVPVVLRQRVVNFVCGTLEPSSSQREEVLTKLEELAAHLAQGYERIVGEAKARAEAFSADLEESEAAVESRSSAAGQ